ncbi:beta-galactosidase [Planctomycetota bacterium]
MDIDQYVRELKEFPVNIVKFNVGGIVANYPTEVKYHYRNTFMKGDLTETVLKRLHAEGIRVIGRFDVSKINEKFAAEHPEWLYVGETGQNVNYNGQVHTCVSGGYQQEYMFKFLGEAIDRYPLDGIFFNMSGYQRSDYSDNYHGICQCDNCRRLFKQYSGMDLPPTQDDTPAYKKYGEFTRMMTDKQFKRVREFFKAKQSDLMLYDGDVIRGESHSPRGVRTYHDTDIVKSTMLTMGRRQFNNTANHFIEIAYRHAGVATALQARRVWEQLVNGAWLGFYCMGPLHRLEDRATLDTLRDIYRFHEVNEAWLLDTKPAGDVGLLRRGREEYQGILQILSEGQVAFELTTLDPEQLKQFPLVILPDAGGLDPGQVAVLDDYVKQGGKLLLIQQVPKELQCLGQVKLIESRPSQKGSYVRIRPEDKTTLDMSVLDDLDLVFLRGRFNVYQTGDDVKKLLRLIPADMFGPPEKSYYRYVSDHPALIYRKHGRGAAACFTFDIGTHYARQAHQGHAALLLGAIDNLLAIERRVLVSAHPLVQINQRLSQNGEFEWLSLYNHSGQSGNALHMPIPIDGIRISFMPRKPVRAVRLLHARQELTFTRRNDGRIDMVLPPLNHYDIVLFEYQKN